MAHEFPEACGTCDAIPCICVLKAELEKAGLDLKALNLPAVEVAFDVLTEPESPLSLNRQQIVELIERLSAYLRGEDDHN